MAYQRQTERLQWIQEQTQLNANNMNHIEDSLDEAFAAMPVIHVSTSEPTSADGNDGDFWVVYTDEV